MYVGDMCTGRNPHRRSAPRGVGRLFACLALAGVLIPTGLRAQACLGFDRDGYLGPAVGLRLQGDDSLLGVGGVAGVHAEQIAARAQVLRFSLTDNFQGSPGFVFARADVAATFPASGLLMCPVMTGGYERVPGLTISERNAPMWGLGLAVGHVVTLEGSDRRIIPSLLVALESSETVPTEGHLPQASRHFSAVLRGGITFGFTDTFIRPYVVINTLADDYVIGGIAAGLTF